MVMCRVNSLQAWLSVTAILGLQESVTLDESVVQFETAARLSPDYQTRLHLHLIVQLCLVARTTLLPKLLIVSQSSYVW